MSKPKRTPGPWQAEFNGRDSFIISKSGFLIATAHSPSKMTSGTNLTSEAKERKREANARLLAAAPELLDALKIAQPYMPKGEKFKKFRFIVRAAIAKAEGELVAVATKK